MTTAPDPPRHALIGSPDPQAEADEVRAAGVTAAGQMAETPPSRSEVRRIALRTSVGVGILVAAIAIVLALLASQDTAEVSGRLAASEESRSQQDAANRARYDEAIRQAEDANRRLAAQGLPQVPIDRTNPASAVVGASTANVLGNLTAAERGSPEPIARAIADTVRSGPPVAMTDVAGAVSTYLTANPAALRGAQGERGAPGQNGTNGTDGADGQAGAQGAPGPAPTAAEIEQAFRTAVADDPQLLCAGQGGEFRLVQNIALADGRSLDAYLCSAGVTGEPTPDPEPTDEPEQPAPTTPPATQTPPDPTPSETADSPPSTFEDGSNGG